MNRIVDRISSPDFFDWAFFSISAVSLLYRLVPAEYLDNRAVTIVYSCIMLVSALIGAAMFFVNFKNRKFRAWVSIMWFYASIETVLRQVYG